MLGPWAAAAVVVGIVVGSGVFRKASVVAKLVPETGPALGVWVFGGVLVMLGALALAELATVLPRAGGAYTLLRAGYGPFAAFLWGWVEFWVVRAASIAALASLFADGLADVLRGANGGEAVLGFWARQAAAVGAIAVLAAVNALGAALGARVQLALTSVKIASILALIALPAAVVALGTASARPPSLANLAPVWPADWSQFPVGGALAALVGVLWAYHGWLNVSQMAEEITDPARSIPRALLGGLALVVALYAAVNAAYWTAVPQAEMADLRGRAVAAEFAARLAGPWGLACASAAIMLSVFGTLNGNLLAGPRLLFAMARDGVIPARVGALSGRARSPAAATLVMAGWSCAVVLGAAMLTQYRLPNLTAFGASLDPNLPEGKDPFDVMTDFAMFGVVGFETLAILAIFRFRARGMAPAPGAYRCPGYPAVPALYGAVMAGVFVNMFASPELRAGAVVGLAVAALGAVVYYAFLRPGGG